METTMRLYYILALLSVAIPRGLGRCSGNETSVEVQWNCGTGETNHTNCSSLNDALNYTLHLAANCSEELTAAINLNSNMTLNNSIFIKGVAEFRLLGSKGQKVVTCTKGAALNFAGITHIPMKIEIQNLSFQSCGNGTAALALSGNCSITFYHLMVENSIGSGLLLENISGTVTVRNSSFENNSYYLERRFGAGVHISSTQSQSSIMFENCNFTGNQAINDSKGNVDIGGGGMCIVFSGRNTSIGIYNCRFSRNIAQSGAGLFASYMCKASSNTLVIDTTVFSNNYYKKDRLGESEPFNSGGGAMVVNADDSNSNTLLIRRCTFTGNTATWGGGLQLFSKPLKALSENHNLFQVVNSTFVGNRATAGSAIDIYCNSASTSPELCNTQPLIEGDSFFTSNGQDHSTYSTLNIDGFPTMISGTISFTENFGSPLLVHKSVAIINEQSLLMFDNNTAQTGGAISLYDSWMTVSSGTRLSFKDNRAYIDGGAIYAHQSNQMYVPYAHDCFIRYSSNTTDPPWRWNSSFEFNGNRARNKTNSIYATSILPCVWKYQNSMSLSENIKATFCKWANWTIHDCIDQIHTSVRNLSNTPDSVQLSPGIPKKFIVGVDDLGHNVTTLSIIPTLHGLPQGKDYAVNYTDEGLEVFGQRTNNLKVRIQVDGDRMAYKTVNVSIGDCPPGFAFSSESLSCKCFEDKRQILQCHGRSWKASLRNGYCITYSEIKHTNQTVYGRCVFTVLPLSHGESHYLPLPEDEKDLGEKLCGLYKRRGLLCGKCIKGFSIDSLSTTYKCHNNTICFSSAAKNWAIYLAVNGLPPLAMFMVILLLHISLTGGATNGFIFFSQVVTLSQELFVLQSTSEGSNIHGAQPLTSLLVNFYSIWSLDLYRIYHLCTGRPLCLGEELRVIDILALHYLSALYPLLLIVVAYFVIELHARNCRIFVCLWKPLCLICTRFRLSLKAQTSVVDAFATFIILSYVKIVRISLLLVTYTGIRTLEDNSLVKLVNNYDPTIVFMSKEHMPFIISGTFFLLTFGLLPVLLLLFYQCRIVQRCLDRCKMNRLGLKTFMDAFQGCYKDGRNGGPDRRFFAGLYLVYRVVIFVIFNLQIPSTIGYFSLLVVCIVIVMQIAFFQPYKKTIFNHLDIFFTCLLAVFFGLHILGFSYLESTLKVPAAIAIVAYCICTIPLLYMIGLVLKKLHCLLCHSKHLRCSVTAPHIISNFCQKMQHSCSSTRRPEPKQFVTYTEISISDDSIPDRLVSPRPKVSTDNTSTWESGYQTNLQ